jgi:hypothetical protein
VDGGALTSATFKPKHTNINWVLPQGIETLVIFGNKKALRSADWLVSVNIHNNGWKHYMHTAKIKKHKYKK